jgi:hypothetical protein
MKQQTTVDWIQQQITTKGITHDLSIGEILDKAKEMEKEKMIEFTDNFWFHCVNRDGSIKITPTQYFNEAYGGNK